MPCHADWAKMSQEEQGRHCKACDKVVRDFTRSSRAEIEAAVLGTPNTCGRFRHDQIDRPDLPAAIFFRFPLQRLKQFVVAFLLVFGFEAFGYSDAQAQQLNGELAEAYQEGKLEVREKGLQNEVIHLKGLVLDSEWGEPIAFATVVVRSGEKVVCGGMSDQDGKFDLRFSLRELREMSYDLIVSYAGRERMKKHIDVDIEEVLVLIDPTVVLETVKIWEGMPMEVTFPPEVITADRTTHTMGIGVGKMIVGTTSISRYRSELDYYHQLDPFVMMRVSDVNPAGGRW